MISAFSDADTSCLVFPIAVHAFFKQTVLQGEVGHDLLQGSGLATKILHLAKCSSSRSVTGQPTLAGRHFVLFPKTKEFSHSISIDLANERISAEDARTLLNRFLSLLSWCDDSYAVLEDGWSGNPIPVPVQRSDGAFSTTPHWVFSRSIPDDPELLQRLAYYREGLNARQAGLVTFEVLSFFKVFERRSRTKPGEQNPTKLWIKDVFAEVSASLRPEILSRFDADRNGKDVEKYVFDNCRVATAHASESFPSDADASPELRRLYLAAEVTFGLARHFIQTEYKLSKVSYSDELADDRDDSLPETPKANIGDARQE